MRLLRARLQLVLLLIPLAFIVGPNCLTDPGIIIHTPTSGSFVLPPLVVVHGTLTDQGLPGEVTVNGTAVYVHPDGQFWAFVPISASEVFHPIDVQFTSEGVARVRHRVTVVATDGGVTTDALPVGQLQPKSLVARLNDSGLDQLESFVAGQVPIDVTDLLPVGTVVVDECFLDGGFLGCLAGARVRIVNPPPTFGSFTVDFDSVQGAVGTTLVVTDLRADFHIDGRGTVPNCDVRITAAATTVSGSFAFEHNAADPSTIDVVQVGGAAVNAVGFDEDFTGGLCDEPIIGDIIQALLPNVENEIESGLADFLNETDASGNTPVAAALEEALVGLDIAGPIGEAVGVTLEADIFDVLEDPDGITILQDTAFLADGCTPPPFTPVFTHTYTPLALPDPYGATTPAGDPYALALGLSSAALNQLLRAEVECGLINIELSEIPPFGQLTGANLSIFVPELAMFPLSTVYEFRVRPTVAPVVTTQPGPGGAVAELLISGLVLKLRDTGGLYGQLMDLVVDARVGLDVSLDGDTLGFSVTPPGPGDVTVTFTLNEIGADEEQIAEGIEGLFALLLPLLGDTIEGLPLPDLLGLQLSGVDVERVGDFFSLYLDVTPAP